MSKSACIAAKAPGYIGIPYQRGEEFRYVVGPEQTRRLDGDCSGLFYALLMDCGVLLSGKMPWRGTADDYWNLATKIDRPSVPGDCCWFPRSGRKTHIAVYIGNGQTIEAGYHGPNNAYPGSGYVGTCTIQQMNARGAVWGRIEGLDIYDEEDYEVNLTEAQLNAKIDERVQKVLVTTYAPDLQEARDGCAREGILEARHKGNLPISTDLFRVALWRVMKKARLV
jgi:hypothetical protein